MQASIVSLQALTDLNLEENLLTGQLPANVGQLHNLSYLGISFNKSVSCHPHLVAQDDLLAMIWGGELTNERMLP